MLTPRGREERGLDRHLHDVTKELVRTEAIYNQEGGREEGGREGGGRKGGEGRRSSLPQFQMQYKNTNRALYITVSILKVVKTSLFLIKADYYTRYCLFGLIFILV